MTALQRYPEYNATTAKTTLLVPCISSTRGSEAELRSVSNQFGIQLSLRLKRHIKWCATAIRVVITFLSVSARRSVQLDDDKVVSEYEEDRPEGG